MLISKNFNTNDGDMKIPKILLKGLARNLKRIRQKKGFTQSQCGLPEEIIKQIEEGKYPVTVFMVAKIEMALELNGESLLGF